MSWSCSASRVTFLLVVLLWVSRAVITKRDRQAIWFYISINVHNLWCKKCITVIFVVIVQSWDKLLETLPVTVAMRLLLSLQLFFIFINCIVWWLLLMVHFTLSICFSFIWFAHDGWKFDSRSHSWKLIYSVISNHKSEWCLSCNMPLLLWYLFAV